MAVFFVILFIRSTTLRNIEIYFVRDKIIFKLWRTTKTTYASAIEKCKKWDTFLLLVNFTHIITYKNFTYIYKNFYYIQFESKLSIEPAQNLIGSAIIWDLIISSARNLTARAKEHSPVSIRVIIICHTYAYI